MRDFTRLFDVLHFQNEKYPRRVALGIREGKGWKTYSTTHALKQIDLYSGALLRLGLQKGDFGAIMARGGSPQWNFSDLAMQQIGMIVAPIHAAYTPDEIAYILKETGAKIIFLENDVLHQKFKKVADRLPDLKFVFSMEKSFGLPTFEENLQPPDEALEQKIIALRDSIRTEDLATVIYTSGTTGEPKGVMLSHRNIVSNIKSTITLVPVSFDKICFSLLPLSHIFERMVTYAYMATGSTVYYARDVESVSDDMQKVRPHFFTAVPRLLERMEDRILEIANERKGFRRKLIRWAVGLARDFPGHREISLNYNFKIWLADLLVFRKWRKALGGKVEGVMVGAAALRQDLCRMFAAAKIPVREGYGLTETSPVVSFNRFEPGGVRFGTVGIPVPGVEVKIEDADENGAGEIWVKGPNVMMGYFKKPEETAAAITPDGWLKTGDVGRFVEKKFLEITDRKKDIFKTSDGKYVSPQRLETQLKSSPFIEQCLVTGYRRPFVAALLAPNFTVLRQWCEVNKVHWTSPQFMVINPKVEKKMQAEIDRLNEGLSNHERIRKFTLLHESWSAESGELSSTLKNRRPVLEERFREEIEKMYK